jgi:hypothetical protein
MTWCCYAFAGVANIYFLNQNVVDSHSDLVAVLQINAACAQQDCYTSTNNKYAIEATISQFAVTTHQKLCQLLGASVQHYK